MKTQFLAFRNYFSELTSRSSKSWIKLFEFSKFGDLVVTLFNRSEVETESQRLIKRILRMVNNNGYNYTFKFLKEIVRLVIHYCADSQTSPVGFWISLDKDRLPRFLPKALRRLITSKDFIGTRLVLTLLSIYRVFPTRVIPDLDSIIGAHTGDTRVLDPTVLTVVARLQKFHVDFGKPKGFISEQAGPNGRKATWFSLWDAFAFLHHPMHLWFFFLVSFRTKNFQFFIWLVTILQVWSPFYLLVVGLGLRKRSQLGKLSVVYDQAGKARVVAIANWWIQLFLKPLHHSIYRWLRGIRQDGTFNQTAPLKDLMSRLPVGTKMFSFDLSSATDRIPVDVLVQILSTCTDGALWRNLVSIPFLYKGKQVRYAVGQGMGTYSSFGMLGAFNHFMVIYAAVLSKGIDFAKTFQDYCVLGDDIVIADEGVALKYKELILSLGIKISDHKSIISTVVCEFAKRIEGPSVSLTPVGAGAVLQGVRFKAMLYNSLIECFNIGINPTFEAFLDVGAKQGLNPQHLVLGSLHRSHGWSSQLGTALGLDLLFYETAEPASILEALRRLFVEELRELVGRDKRSSDRSIAYFERNWFKRTTLTYPWSIQENLALVSSPGFWIYYMTIIRSFMDLHESHKLVHSLEFESLDLDRIGDAYLTVAGAPQGIDWGDRKLVQELQRRVARLADRLQSEAASISEIGDEWY